MPTVFIPPLLRPLAAGANRVELDGPATVRQVIRALEARYPGIAVRLCAGDDLAPGLAVAVDGHVARQGLSQPVSPTSEVHFLPAIGGG